MQKRQTREDYTAVSQTAEDSFELFTPTSSSHNVVHDPLLPSGFSLDHSLGLDVGLDVGDYVSPLVAEEPKKSYNDPRNIAFLDDYNYDYGSPSSFPLEHHGQN